MLIFTFALILSEQSVFAGEKNCIQRFLHSIKEIISPEINIKSSYSFTEAELSDVNAFLKSSNKIHLNGFNEKADRFQQRVLMRYADQMDQQAVNALGKLDNFRMVNNEFFADINIKKINNTLIVNIPEIGAKNAGAWGNASKGLDLGLAKFFATLRKGIEFRSSLNPDLELILIQPSKVVNRKLKFMLEDLGFEKISELPDWKPIPGFKEGMGPAAEYRMKLKVEVTQP